MADEHDDLAILQCCIWSTVYNLLDGDPILNPPKYGSPSHAGPDFCCDALYVHMGDSFEFPGVADDECTHQMTHDFVVTLGIPACSEGRLGEPGGCAETGTPCLPARGGCYEPVHEVGGPCVEGSRPTVLGESAYVWRARSLLTKELACSVMCCVKPQGMTEPCVDIPCRTISLVSVTQQTEGGCAYLELTLRARW